MSVSCCIRSILALRHALIGVGAGFFCFYSLIGWSYEMTCLPSLVDQFGDLIPYKNDLVCESLLYVMAIISLVNFAMCLIINWQWQNACVTFISLMLTIIYIAFAVMGGTAFAMYYLVWCNSLERKFVGSHGCEDAAQGYDLYNVTGQMSLYKTRMEVQMASLWAMFPLTGFTVLAHSLPMRIFAKPDARVGPKPDARDRWCRYVILREKA